MPAMTERNRSPSEICNRLDCYMSVSAQIKKGLNGTPFHWNGTEGEYNVMWAQDMGITLVTATQVKKRGYRLKRGASPVGWRYFTAPISQSAPLYVLECQCVKLESDKG